MIRPAKAADVFEIVGILKARQPETRYAGLGIDESRVRKMFAAAAMRHGHTTEGGTFLMVHEVDGTIDAFVFGVLQPAYMIFDQLAATDVFLLGLPGANPRALVQLLDAYIAWAEANPRVFEIGASWADTIPGNEGVIRAIQRRGFSLCSQTFRRDARPAAMEIAA